MKTIISHSIPFKDVIKDLAKEMSTDFSASCQEYSITIPKSLGEGSISGINFSEGIGLLIYDCTFKEDVEIQFIVNEVHPLKFMFCEEGDFEHRFQDSEKNHEVESMQNIVVASDKNRGHILRFKKGTHIKIDNLEINRKQFNEVMSCEVEGLKPGLKGLFKDVAGRNYFYHLGNYSLKTADAFSRIAQFEGTPFQRHLLLHSISYYIFYIQILEYWDGQSPEEHQSMLLKRELKQIQEAALLVESDISNFNNVKDLALKVGLNQNKLQNGFKEVFGMTVNSFVQEHRLSQASLLIKNTALNFGEIADKVGISSKSYFSKIFKDKYGLTPSEIRNKK